MNSNNSDNNASRKTSVDNNPDSSASRKNSVAERIAALQRKNTPPTSTTTLSSTMITASRKASSNITENTSIASRIAAMQQMQQEIGCSKDSNKKRKPSGKVSALAAGMKGLDMKAMLSGAPHRKSKVRNSVVVDSPKTLSQSDDIRIADLCHIDRVTIGYGRRRGRKINSSMQELKFSTE